MRPARTLAKKGNIPVGYYKDEKKTAETFRTINGVRYAIPGAARAGSSATPATAATAAPARTAPVPPAAPAEAAC